MKVTQKLKTHFKIIAALCIALSGGITIWSCSQDELGENGQSVYRYTAEEIATLKTMAEEYGIPDVKFPTESNQRLNSMKEMEEIFKTFSIIGQSVGMPLEQELSDSKEFIYRTKEISFCRNRMKKASGAETSSGYTERFDVTVLEYRATLEIRLSWSSHYDFKNKKWNYSLNVSGDLEIPMYIEDTGYFYKDAKTTYRQVDDNSIEVAYSCNLCHYDKYNGSLVTSPLSFKQSVNLPPKP